MRPPESYLMKYVSNIDAPFIDPREEGALEDHPAALRVWVRYREREIFFPLTSLSILTSQIALRRYATRRKNDTIMKHERQDFDQKTDFLEGHSSIHEERWWSHMHALAKTKRSWTNDSLPWETNFQDLPSSLEHVHKQGGQQGRTGNLPPYTFGMGNVKEENNNLTDISEDTLSTLSLLGTLDPYWKFQQLVEYSKDLHTCMVLDDWLHEESY